MESNIVKTIFDNANKTLDAYLFEELNASLQIHTEVDKDPVNALGLVLLLLKHEHVVVEELLQFLVTEVDADLLEAVELKGNMKMKYIHICVRS